MSAIGTPEDSGNRRRILLADDHPLVLERVTKYYSRHSTWSG